MDMGKSSDQVRWITTTTTTATVTATSSSSDEQIFAGGGHVRLYRCTFCQRGFSNAQALGGHMNVHRRDRAKLRDFSDVDDCENPGGLPREPPGSVSSDESPEKGVVGGKVDDDDDVDKGININPLLLPLFVDTAQLTGIGVSDVGKGKSVISMVSSKPPGSDGGASSALASVPELDLELRLGVEPHQHV